MERENCPCSYCVGRREAVAQIKVIQRNISPIVDVENDSDLEIVEREDQVVTISSDESGGEGTSFAKEAGEKNFVEPRKEEKPRKEYKDASTQTDREFFAVLGLDDPIPNGAEEVCVVGLGQPFDPDEFKL